jgi:hypothetical protein
MGADVVRALEEMRPKHEEEEVVSLMVTSGT